MSTLARAVGRLRRDTAVTAGLAALAFALALAQRPGLASSDTKIDLHVDPLGFLADVAAVWTPTGSLGHVQGGQYSGYLFPMGPVFALGHGVGLPPWLVHRLWLGLVLALAAWGTVRLLDALLGRPRGVAHFVAGLLVLLNPYVIVFANRTSVTLLGYAALPWLLLVVARGLRGTPAGSSAGVRARLSGWWWPAAFALVITASGGGVNAAVTAWILVGPALLVLHETAVRGVIRPSAAWAFSWRAAVLTAVASAWWVAPILVQASYGIDFLRFTEQPGSIWQTTSIPESLRLMGYWISYLGVGYGDRLGPYFSDAATLLFNPVVVTATLVVPGLCVLGFAWSRRWTYGPFFLALVIVGLLVMSAGFPEGTPLRKGLTFAYNQLTAVQFLRTTYKAGPLVALGLAVLGGVAAGEAARRLRGRPVAGLAAAAGATALVAVAGLPFLRGDAVDPELGWSRIPPAWTGAARGLDRDLPRNTRAVVLPGQPFAFYRWGGTVDPILPALTERPVAVRNVPPYADLHAVDLLYGIDALVQQARLLPGQLDRLLDLLSAGAVVTGTDDRTERSGAVAPAEAARVLEGPGGLGAPDARYGRSRRFPPATGGVEAPTALPEVRRHDRRATRGLVRVEPAGPATLVDGSADGLFGLAALGALPRARPLEYAGDRSAEQLRRAATAGAELVISDSNRRRVFVAPRVRQTAGATLGPDDPLSEDAAELNPFPARGTDGQTVARLDGARYVRAPFSPGFSQFPEQRPSAAFDGSERTFWLADPTLEERRHWVEVGLLAPRDVAFVDVKPHNDPRARVTRVAVNDREFAVRPGWNRLAVRLTDVEALRLRVAGRVPDEGAESAGGFDEVRVPGLRVRERLRPPRLLERAVAGADLRRSSLTYLFARTTGDDPYRRSPRPAPVPVGRGRDRAEVEAALARGAGDAELGLERELSPPVARRFRADGWVTVAPDAPDPAVDRLAGTDGPVRFTSSGRFQGQAGRRASRAFDGAPGRAWIAPWAGDRPAWVGWELERPVRVGRLRVAAPTGAVRRPALVRLRVGPGGGGRTVATPPLRVAAGGEVRLPRALRGRAFRLEVLEARPARGAATAAVGIGEVSGPGVPRARPARGGDSGVVARCGEVAATVGRGVLRVRPVAPVSDLEAGRPLRARPCGAGLDVPAGPQRLSVAPGLLRPELLRLRSEAPRGVPDPVGGGRLTSPGRFGRGRREDVRVALTGPSWLVLGESYNRGWRASCDGRSLGPPTVVDGFANGWRADRGCRRVELAFAPQRAVRWGYGLGALAAAALVLLLAIARPRRAPPGPSDLPGVRLPEPALARPSARRALVAGLAAAAVLGFVFALRAGVVIGPAVALLLWRGAGPRALTLAAGGLLAVVVPALYLAFPPRDRGGYNNDFALETLAAHWVGVAAVVLLLLALARTLPALRHRPSGADGPERPPLSTATDRTGDRAPGPARAGRRRSPA